MPRCTGITLLVFAVMVVTSGFYAQAASSLEAIPNRGEGLAGISGYVVSDVHYSLAESPENLRAVDFSLDGPASLVVIDFNAPAGQQFSCRDTGGQRWHCEVFDVSVAEINSLRVIALD